MMENDDMTAPLIPVRILNEFVYCPRLAYIEWVCGEFEDNIDTLEGRYQHRRVDRQEYKIEGDTIRSVVLSSPKLGLVGKIDLIELHEDEVVPVDYKKGDIPRVRQKAYEPERVQLCAFGLILKEAGHACSKGVLYFAGSKRRVVVKFDERLITKTTNYIQRMREAFLHDRIPPPLKESKKCLRCSLAGICLPDETNLLQRVTRNVRPIYVKQDSSHPVYVVGHDTSIRKSGERMIIEKENNKKIEVPLRNVSALNIFGYSRVTPQLLRELLTRGIPVYYFTTGGWFYGCSIGHFHKNVILRKKQFEIAANPEESIKIARKFVEGKLKNSRTMLRRNHPDPPEDSLRILRNLAMASRKVTNLEELLGIEGRGAHIYFSEFKNLLKSQDFNFEERNKRPPRDPVNAVLSYLYSLLAKECFTALHSVGFDPYMGFYHKPRYGKPSLSLDLMEEFRPIIADSVALTLFNNNVLLQTDFIITPVGSTLTSDGKKKVIREYERRLKTEIKHPLFHYKASYRRIIEIQARILSRVVIGELNQYTPFLTR